MRARHALRQDENTILWNGNTYRLVPDFQRELLVSDDYSGEVYITAPNVPVLLSRHLNENMASSQGDGVILLEYSGEDRVYCRADRYDSLVAAIEADAPAVRYYYTYFDATSNDTQIYYLSEEQIRVLEAAWSEAVPMDSSEVRSQSAVTLFAATEDGWFREYVIDMEYGEDVYYFYNSFGDTFESAQVPAKYNSVFAEIVAKDREWYYDQYVFAE